MQHDAVPDPLATPGRIAFAGDWHANTRWGIAAIQYAAERAADVIVHLGDFGYEYRAAFLDGLDRALTRTGLRLLFVDGNHEDFPTLLRYPVRTNGLRQVTSRIWHLPRGFRWAWGGISWLALGGAHSVDRPWREPGTSWWREETITDVDMQRATTGGAVDVMVSHDCPAGVPIPGLAESSHLWPAEELVAADAHRVRMRTVAQAVRARSIWHGHFHRRYTATADLGYGPVAVHGMDCDGSTLDGNVQVLGLDEIPAAENTLAADGSRLIVDHAPPGAKARGYFG
jgi:hypothetical protein